MHRLCCWNTLDIFLEDNPDVDINEEKPILDRRFYRWLTDTAEKGIDGSVIESVLFDRGLNFTKHDKLMATRLRNNELGPILGTANGRPANYLDFWYACKLGYNDDVLTYCKCLQPLNEEKVDRNSSERLTGLAMAARYGRAVSK